MGLNRIPSSGNPALDNRHSAVVVFMPAARPPRPKSETKRGDGIDDMLTPRTCSLALLAAALTATAIANRHQSKAGVPITHLQTERSTAQSADDGARSVYLPDRFHDEERAAPIEPMPPQY
ncbi:MULTISPECIES: hypothetical protein [Ramlibacter]|uniref:Uncharacterized protein n=1 Tax=Ramlibacter pinisoli TaxID=2682844 RepID=A0A6N8ITR9_9BURK|nr:MULTISPECIES: hypothetical protein [Ramlibacter]MBA2964460.1 hypothetical protein [Ramlibacter sp. CGMCC 1.13660]MVQ29426.1 hypothetical protein [Ramlibacter pinisoli]